MQKSWARNMMDEFRKGFHEGGEMTGIEVVGFGRVKNIVYGP